MRRCYYLILPLAALLFACSEKASPNPPTTVIPAQVTGPPGQTAVPETTLPAPGKDTGIVTGYLLSKETDSPLPNMGVYLGEYIYLTPGPDYLVSLRQEGSPHSATDGSGRFVITEVPPGDYPIIAWTPFSSYVVPDEKGESELVVNVQAGQIIDVGELIIDWP